VCVWCRVRVRLSGVLSCLVMMHDESALLGLLGCPSGIKGGGTKNPLESGTRSCPASVGRPVMPLPCVPGGADLPRRAGGVGVGVGAALLSLPGRVGESKERKEAFHLAANRDTILPPMG